MMNTLAEWKKRLIVDTKIRQTYNFREGQTDHIFTITQVQTNGVFAKRSNMDQRSWFEFPKRAEIEFTENGWKRIEQPRPGKRGVFIVAEYEWVEEPQTTEQTPNREESK